MYSGMYQYKGDWWTAEEVGSGKEEGKQGSLLHSEVAPLPQTSALVNKQTIHHQWDHLEE
jgi:hypothetical protein